MSKEKNWKDFFLKIAETVAQKSEDESTKVGAVIVGEDNTIISTGYNGLPRGIENLPERNLRPQKYFFFEHSERNAIYNAARLGIRLKGSTLYLTHFPCIDCARGIIQAGIKKIVISVDLEVDETFKTRWSENFNISKPLLEEAGVELDYVQVFGD